MPTNEENDSVKNDSVRLVDEIDNSGNGEQKEEANANEQLDAEIKNQENLSDAQNQEIKDQLSIVEVELNAALNSKPQDPDLIAELQKMKEALETSSQQLQTYRQRLNGCAEKSRKVSNNFKTIRDNLNDVINDVRQKIFSGSAGKEFGDSTNPDDLQAELNSLLDVSTDLTEKLPKIQAELNENIKLLDETKVEVDAIKDFTAELGTTLASSKERLAAIQTARLEAQQAVSASKQDSESPPPLTPIGGTSSGNAAENNTEIGDNYMNNNGVQAQPSNTAEPSNTADNSNANPKPL